MDFMKGFTSSAAKAASEAAAQAKDAAAHATPRAARSKFRNRGQKGGAAAEHETAVRESEPIELLIKKPAEDSSSTAEEPARRRPWHAEAPAPSKPAADSKPLAAQLPTALTDNLPPELKDQLRLPEDERIKRYMDAAATLADSHHSGCASCLRAATPVVTALIWVAAKVAPLYLWLFRKAYWFYTWAPKNVLQMCFGVALAFFGGTYLVAIAAVEAFRQMGWQRTWADLKVVYAEMRLVYDASEKDDLIDADGDGVIDVAELTPQQLATRKLSLAMRTVKEPERLQSAVGSLWAAYLAVLATLRLEFARVAALALGIAEMVKLRAVKLLAPPLSSALGAELKHWVPTLITTAINVAAVIFAWYVQQIVSAFYSALRGGKMFAEALFAFLNDRGWLARLPCVAKPFDPNDSYLDEVVGYLLAGCGFVFQLKMGFELMFPLNLVFLPLTIIEWFLRFQVVMGPGTPGSM